MQNESEELRLDQNRTKQVSRYSDLTIQCIIRACLLSCIATGTVLVIQQFTFMAWGPIAVFNNGIRYFEVQRLYDWPLSVVGVVTAIVMLISLDLNGRRLKWMVGVSVFGIVLYWIGLWSFLDCPTGGGVFSEVAPIRPPQVAGPRYGKFEEWQQNRLVRQLCYDPGFVLATLVGTVLTLAAMFLGDKVVEKKGLDDRQE